MPKPGQIYRHFKNKLYQIITIALHTESAEELVIYQALYGNFKTYARPLSMFVSEVDKTKYPDIQQTYRFELVELEQEETPDATDIHVRDTQNHWDKNEKVPNSGLNNTIFNYSLEYSPDTKSENFESKDRISNSYIEKREEAYDNKSDLKEINTENEKNRFNNDVNITVNEKLNQDLGIEASAEALLRIEEETGTVNPILMEFLEADSYQEKLSILIHKRKNIDDKVLNDMAVSMDYTLDGKDLDDRFQGFIFCLQTHVRFEDRRLR